jgi:hypothetical protein
MKTQCNCFHWCFFLAWACGLQLAQAVSKPLILAIPPAGSPANEVSFQVQHKIVTHDDPAERDLKGKLTLSLVSGNASIIEFKVNGNAYTLGTPINIVEPGHSGCGDHTWHAGNESVTAKSVGNTPGKIVIKAQVDPDQGRSQITEELTIYVVKMSVQEVDFAGSTVGDLLSDNRTTLYSKPHWKDSSDDGDATDSGDKRYPIAYVKNSIPTIGGKVKILPAGMTSVTPKMRVTGPGNIKTKDVSVSLSSITVDFPATLSNGALEDHIDFFQAMELRWEVSFDDGSNWYEIGKTTNRTYVTLKVPLNALRQETLFDVGSRNAVGATDAATAFPLIWGKFKGPSPKVSRVDPAADTATLDPGGMVYWRPGGNADVGVIRFLRDGDASCGTWAKFMIACLDAQGISGHTTAAVETNDLTASDRVRATTDYKAQYGISNSVYYNSPTSGTKNYPSNPPTPPLRPLAAGDIILEFETNNDTNDGIFFVKTLSLGTNKFIPIPANDAGFPGSSSVAQGNANARAWFGNHALVKYDGKYYDPSYGKGPYNSKIEWENDSLERFGGIVKALKVVTPSPLTRSVKGQHLWNDKADTKGSPETNINP